MNERDLPAGSQGSSGSSPLDEDSEAKERGLTMAELKAEFERERQTTELGAAPAPELPRNAGPSARDDELLDELPATDHHLGALAGWRAASWQRWVIGVVIATLVIVSAVLLIQHRRDERHARLHPVPELEATIAPGSPREMTYTEGKFRIMLSREAPAVNLVHLPDRDITLARGVDRASFKVEVRDGKTIALDVLTGEIVETLTRDDAESLLSDD